MPDQKSLENASKFLKSSQNLLSKETESGHDLVDNRLRVRLSAIVAAGKDT
jgi:hypothetical protein